MIRIGLSFQEERKRKGLALEEVARATKIREEFLQYIENGEYKKLPSSAYAYGFVRNYARFLGLPVEKSLALFRREFDDKKIIEVLPKGLARAGGYHVPRFRIGRSTILIGAVFVIISAFLFFQYRSAIFNPSISIDYPAENQTIKSLTFEVKGKTDPNATLTIDNQEVSIENDGKFRKKITVFPGNSTINFKVENKFGRVTVLDRSVIVKPGY